MPFKLVILWTDALVFLLVAAVVALVWHVRRHEHLAAPWRKVARDPSGMAAATVLAVFVVIGLADSVHYRPAIGAKDGRTIYAVDVLSLLDAAAAPLRARREKTYSAPFATHLYSKETIELPDGKQARDYPRLTHGGSHLKNPEVDLAPDISRRALWGFSAGLVAWLVAALLVCALVARRAGWNMETAWRSIWHGETEVPWRAVLIAVGVMLAIGAPLLALAAKYHV